MGWGEGRELNKESKLLGFKLKQSLKLRCRGTYFQFWLGNTSSIVLCLVAQLCSTLCKPMDSLFMGILQARTLEWVAMPSSSRSSWPRDWSQVSCIAGGFFTNWATRQSQEYWSGSSLPSPGDLPNLEIELVSPELQMASLPTELPEKPRTRTLVCQKCQCADPQVWGSPSLKGNIGLN